MNYINNWVTRITAPLAAAAATLPIPPSAASRLDLTGVYWLTLTDSANPLEQTKWEVVEVSSGLAIQRGMDGTTAQDWPVDTLIYCAVSAGQLAALQSRIDDLESASGGGGGSGTISGSGDPNVSQPTALAGEHYLDNDSGLIYILSGSIDSNTSSPVWVPILPAVRGHGAVEHQTGAPVGSLFVSSESSTDKKVGIFGADGWNELATVSSVDILDVTTVMPTSIGIHERFDAGLGRSVLSLVVKMTDYDPLHYIELTQVE